MKTPLTLAILIAVLLTGCAGTNAKPHAYAPSQTKVELLGNGLRFERVPVADHPCEPANIYFINEAKGVRQVVIDWDKLGKRSTYTLSRKGRDDLVTRIRDAGAGCEMPALIESKHIDHSYVGATSYAETYGFVRYWLDGEVIRFKARQFIFDINPQTKQIKTAEREGVSDIDPQTGQMRSAPVDKNFGFNFTDWRDLKTYWGYDPYNGPVASPQVAYRIDEHRFFEIVPYQQYPCDEARLFYTDTAKGIHTNVMDARFGYGTFIIDAANDQYLVGPVLHSSSGCQTGDSSSFKCASRLPYSTDAGRTWKLNIPEWSGDNVLITKDQIYAGGRATIHDLKEGYVDGIWQRVSRDNFPKPRKAPIDTEIHCNRDDKE